MKRLAAFLWGLLVLVNAGAQNPAQQYVNRQAHTGVLGDAVWGVLAVGRDGRTLVSLNQSQRLVPASNMKLVTTGTALHQLGPLGRFRTELGYTGTIKDGVLEGDVYIIGHGDPTLGVADSIATDNAKLFWRWKSLLKEAGISAIHGRIVGDGSAYEGNLEHRTWGYDDIGTYYGAGTNALSFYANAIDFDVCAAAQGELVQVRQTYPETPWLQFQNYSITGPAGTGNSLYLYTTDLGPYAEMRGSFATDRKPKTEHFANKFGALTCAYYFWKNLQDTGWEVTGGYADVDRGGNIRTGGFSTSEKAGKPALLGETYSAPIAAIARITNVRSDNFYAEALLRAMGEEHTGIALYDSCLVAVRQVLTELGANADGIRQVDGSGLSRMNYVSPEWMVNFLQAMQQSPAFDVFLSSLPCPGEGTLSALLPNLPARERIRIKSGSMDGVLCYSGYILAPDGTPQITLSIMTNNATATPREVRAVLAHLLKLLMEEI